MQQEWHRIEYSRVGERAIIVAMVQREQGGGAETNERNERVVVAQREREWWREK